MAGFAKMLELRVHLVEPGFETEEPAPSREQARLEEVARSPGPAGLGTVATGRSALDEEEVSLEPRLPQGLVDEMGRRGIPVGEDELLSLKMAAGASAPTAEESLAGFVVTPMEDGEEVLMERPHGLAQELTPDQLDFLGVEGEEEVLLSAMRPPRERMM